MPIIEVKKVFVSLIALVNNENEVLIGKRPAKNNFRSYDKPNWFTNLATSSAKLFELGAIERVASMIC